MPLYEYRCAACDRTQIEIRNVAERDDDASCAVCGGAAARAVSRSNFYLRADATQSGGWNNPGMSGVNYDSGRAPDGMRGTHLRRGY